MNDSTTPIPRWKLLLFLVVLVLTVLTLPIFLLEIGLRIGGVHVSDDPYLQFGRVNSFFTKVNIGGSQYYQVSAREVYRERRIVFSVKKAPGTFRIFCLGGSASAGWPHPSQEIYSTYLEENLRRAYPDKTIEVINVSAHAYAAYRVRLIFKEIMEFEPDLLILYTGDNEFLEKRTYNIGHNWLDPISRLANYSILFRIMRGSALGRWVFPANTLQGAQRDHTAYADWSKLEQLALDLRRDPDQFAFVKTHYAYAVESMVRGARDKNVPIMLVTDPVNLRDWQPNVSYQALDGTDLEGWETHYVRGRVALLRENYDTAVDDLRLARALNPQHAATYYYLGRALEATGQPTQAYDAFSRARDLDYNPFRAISDFNATLREIAVRYDGVTLVDAEAQFRSASAPFAPGFDLFLDYVHPTKRGNLLIAETVFNSIVENKLIRGSFAAVRQFHHEAQPYHCSEERLYVGRCRLEGLEYEDNRDFAMQVTLIRLFAIMHQAESLVAKANYLLATPGAMETLSKWAVSFVHEAVSVYTLLIAEEERGLLDDRLSPTEIWRARDNLNQFYRKYFPGYEEFKEDLEAGRTSAR